MKAELENMLLDRFGKYIYTTLSGDWMGDAIHCNDGWYVILYMFFQELENKEKDIRFNVIKEKFGWLHVYPDLQYLASTKKTFPTPKGDVMLDPEILDMIHILEWKSYETCEYCGKPGVIRWEYEHIRSLCDSCTLQYKEGTRPIPTDEIKDAFSPKRKFENLAGFGRAG